MKSDDVLAVLMAGGRSLRMGEDKAFVRLGGKPLAAWTTERLRSVFEDVCISGEPAKYASLGLLSYPDVQAGVGPLGGFAATLEAAQDRGKRGIFAVACDMPYLDAGVLRRLLALWEDGDDGVIPVNRAGFPEPLCAGYGLACLPAIHDQIRSGDYKIARFFERVKLARVSWDSLGPAETVARHFQNLNTPDALRAVDPSS